MTALVAALLFVATPAPAKRQPDPPQPSVLISEPYQRVAIDQIDYVPWGAKIEVVGYFSHKANETDGDLQVYLIDHRGGYIVVEAPRKFRSMKYFIRSLHVHRGEVLVVRGTLTRQIDKPTARYPSGWLEINPVETMARFEGPLPADLHYTRVVHHLFGRTITEYK